jgi:predicted acylesterase/phospholipase RssA
VYRHRAADPNVASTDGADAAGWGGSKRRFVIDSATTRGHHRPRTSLRDATVPRGEATTDETIRILSIDGGGIRGIIPAIVLRELLGDLRAQDAFHMIAGTSTGGILACGLAKPDPFSPQTLLDLYVQHGREIFDRPWWGALPGADLIEPKYSAADLERYLAQELGDARLSDIAAVGLIVPSYAIQLPEPRPNGETRSAMFFRSWQARGRELPPGKSTDEYDFFLRDVCRATSAAPTYFPPADIRNRAGQRFGMIDGGVFANNPAMCALAAAWRLYGRDRPCLVVSLGTGMLQKPIPLDEAKGWGEIGWATQVVPILRDGVADTVVFEADLILRGNQYRFDIPLGADKSDPDAASDKLDDVSPANIRALIGKAEALVTRERAKIDKVAELLREPRPPVA